MEVLRTGGGPGRIDAAEDPEWTQGGGAATTWRRLAVHQYLSKSSQAARISRPRRRPRSRHRKMGQSRTWTRRRTMTIWLRLRCTLSVSHRFVAGRDDSRSADSFVRAFRPPAGDSRTRLSALLRLRPHRVVSVSPEIVAGRVNLSSSSSSSFSSSEMGRSRTRTRRRTMTIGLRLGRAALYVSGRLLAKSTVGNAASAW